MGQDHVVKAMGQDHVVKAMGQDHVEEVLHLHVHVSACSCPMASTTCLYIQCTNPVYARQGGSTIGR